MFSIALLRTTIRHGLFSIAHALALALGTLGHWEIGAANGFVWPGQLDTPWPRERRATVSLRATMDERARTRVFVCVFERICNCADI